MFWIRKSNVLVQSCQVLENTCHFMSPFNLDDYCQCILDARKFFKDQPVTQNTLQHFGEQHLDQTATSCLKIVKGRNEKYKLFIGYVVIGNRRDVICYESNLLLENIFIIIIHPYLRSHKHQQKRKESRVMEIVFFFESIALL